MCILSPTLFCELCSSLKRKKGAAMISGFLPGCFCFLFAGKTTRTPTATVTTRWLLPWMEIKLYWAARTTTKRPWARRITRPRARLCSWAPAPACSPCTASRPRRDPAPSRCPAGLTRCTITTHCTTTPYWTLCLLIWWTSAPKEGEQRGLFFVGKVRKVWDKHWALAAKKAKNRIPAEQTPDK